MRPTDYGLQNGCWNCGNVFVQHDYGGDMFWCACGAKDTRPFCGEVSNGEEWPRASESAIEDYDAWLKSPRSMASAAWDAWSKGREVSREGKCGRWMIGKE